MNASSDAPAQIIGNKLDLRGNPVIEASNATIFINNEVNRKSA
jgi:hypothetical protein